MKKLLSAALMALACALVSAPPALASYTILDSNRATQTFCSTVYLGVHYPCNVVYGLFGGVPTALAVDGSGYVGVNVQSSALPSGGATSALQTTNGGKLDTIHADLAALTPVATGQAIKASSIPVTPPSDPDYRSSTSTITAADVATTSAAGQSNVSQISGTPTANSYIVWSVNGASSASVAVSNTFVGTTQLEASWDGGTKYVIVRPDIKGTAEQTSTITAPGAFLIRDLRNATNVRLRATAWTSGTLSAVLDATAAPGSPLPPTFGASGKTAVTAALTSATCTSAFTPIAGRTFNVSAWGTFTATFELDRSFDSGVTKLPITAAGTQLYQWTAAASEQADEPEFGVNYYVCVTSYGSGTVNLRLSQ